MTELKNQNVSLISGKRKQQGINPDLINTVAKGANNPRSLTEEDVQRFLDQLNTDDLTDSEKELVDRMKAIVNNLDSAPKEEIPRLMLSLQGLMRQLNRSRKTDDQQRMLIILGLSAAALWMVYKVWEDPKIMTEIGYIFEAIYHIMLGLLAIVVIGYPTYVVISCISEGSSSISDIISCSIEKILSDVAWIIEQLASGLIDGIFGSVGLPPPGTSIQDINQLVQQRQNS